jgi:hypothetical protein
VAPSVEQRLARVHAELGRRGAPSRASLARSLALGAVVGLVVALLGVAFMGPAEPLVASARGGSVAVGALLSAAQEEVPVSFSDGTLVSLGRDSRARVVRIDEHGAELALERGTLRATVVPRPDARWVVAAGPFEIRVTGTRFDASWDPVSERLRVAMEEGSVRVTGSCLSEPRALGAGDVSEFSCAPKRTVAAPDPAPALPRPADPEPAPRASTRAAPAAADWRELARESRFKDALVAAEGVGFSGLCARLGASDVLELGNVARLAGNPARAAEAYLAVRQRFAGSGNAASAAFQLGRIAFDGSRDYGSARRWFGAYLAEAPGGGLAQEALGRLMEAEHRSGDRAAARTSAERYLARFPGGAHAGLAQSLTAE